MFDAIADAISRATGTTFDLESARTVGGGCINEGYRLTGRTGSYFVKLNRRSGLDMFEAEAAGLEEMATSPTVRVPAVICHGQTGHLTYLVLEWIDLRSDGASGSLGRQLAGMHSFPQAYFGWHRDNTIGSTPQRNERHDDWIGFWRNCRLGFQLDLAARLGHGGSLQRIGKRLMDSLEGFFDGYRPYPSLLHGDLWGGNAAYDAEGRPVIFDPACYYGDREADLAMTELFGGFGRDFYEGYQDVLPLEAGYEIRKHLYNVYHILNHLNLFGGGYGKQAEGMMGRLLAELR
jgi:fructosamine-3-kinase